MADLTLPIRLDPTSPPDETLHVTASGLPVRIYATDGGGPRPIHGVFWRNNTWQFMNWLPSGSAYEHGSSDFDLRDRAPVKRGVWVAWLERHQFARIFRSEEEAREEVAAMKSKLLALHYLAEGDGLDTPADPPLLVDWTKLPEWANWAAADEDGRACYYDVKPDICAGGSLHGRFWHPRQSNWRRGLLAEGQYRLAPGFDWRKTLIQRPEGV